MFHLEYIARRNVARVVLKLFIAMTMKMILLQRIEKNVTSESTLSALLTS